ncbi:hypothetical protein LZ31DRAFT_272612 [Colletotrichum somersetense]|nr:hypothetical protein LZ31DRAFT_272612 [Colletotrichum somersetense]
MAQTGPDTSARCKSIPRVEDIAEAVCLGSGGCRRGTVNLHGLSLVLPTVPDTHHLIPTYYEYGILRWMTQTCNSTRHRSGKPCSFPSLVTLLRGWTVVFKPFSFLEFSFARLQDAPSFLGFQLVGRLVRQLETPTLRPWRLTSRRILPCSAFFRR